MKATEQCFPVVLLIMLYKVVLTFESVNEILKCGHSNESLWAVLSCGAVYNAVQVGKVILILSLEEILKVRALDQCFPLVMFFVLFFPTGICFQNLKNAPWLPSLGDIKGVIC